MSQSVVIKTYMYLCDKDFLSTVFDSKITPIAGLNAIECQADLREYGCDVRLDCLNC